VKSQANEIVSVEFFTDEHFTVNEIELVEIADENVFANEEAQMGALISYDYQKCKHMPFERSYAHNINQE
jgi:hypothetical protein